MLVKEDIKNFFSWLQRVLYYFIMLLYIYVFYCIVYDNGMLFGKFLNIVVVQCINQLL